MRPQIWPEIARSINGESHPAPHAPSLLVQHERAPYDAYSVCSSFFSFWCTGHGRKVQSHRKDNSHAAQFVLGGERMVVYVPNHNFVGDDELTFRVLQGDAESPTHGRLKISVRDCRLASSSTQPSLRLADGTVRAAAACCICPCSMHDHLVSSTTRCRFLLRLLLPPLVRRLLCAAILRRRQIAGSVCTIVLMNFMLCVWLLL